MQMSDSQTGVVQLEPSVGYFPCHLGIRLITPDLKEMHRPEHLQTHVSEDTRRKAQLEMLRKSQG